MALKMECAREIELKDWGGGDNKQVLYATDNLFQLALQQKEIWNNIAKILAKWKEGEIKSQKQAKTPKSGS